MTPDPVPPIYTRLARLSTWLLLAGLIFFPTAHIHPEPTAPQRASDPAPFTFPVMVLPPLCCFLGTAGIVALSLLRRADHLWLSTHLLAPALAASLASLALVFYLVYKDGRAEWMRMETVTAIVAGVYSAVFVAASVAVRTKHRRGMQRAGETGLEEGRGGAPQIPEVERVTSLKDELLPDSREAS